MRRGARRERPAVESLEGRSLLSIYFSGPSNDSPKIPWARYFDNHQGITLKDRRLDYVTPQGTHVIVTLYGLGSLAGSRVDADGALNLVYQGTNAQTGIIGRVSGGTGAAFLRSILPANVPPQTLSGVGISPVNIVNLKDFDLVAGGRINLTAGVHLLTLNSAAENTQVNLRELPQAVQSGGTTATSGGENLLYGPGLAGSLTLTTATGQFVPAANIVVSHTLPNGLGIVGAPPAPPGLVIIVHHVHGPARGTSNLPNAELFGYDPVANAVVRFGVQTDPNTGTATGTPDLTIPAPFAPGSPLAGIALGLNGGRQVALVGSGTTVYAYDASTGVPAGRFSVAGLAGGTFHQVDGIGSTDARTVVEDAQDGLLQIVDVTASLASGQAVPVGAPFMPGRQFDLSGGLTGVPGSTLLYATGAAHFDTFQPDRTQAGILTLNTAGGQLSESARTAVKKNGNFVDAGPSGTASANPSAGLGSLDQFLAQVTGTSNGVNTVALLNQGFSPAGTLTLNDPNRLAGLSETFRPALAGAALFDVQGTVQSFRALDAQGLVLNDLGDLNLVKIDSAVDTTIVGLPFGHADIPYRQNVTILTSPRAVGDRNGVTVVPGLRPAGPLTLP